MPREITFKISRKQYTAAPVKVSRRKLYGWTELNATDDQGRPCELLTADESGKIIPLGGTGIGILSESGRWIERSELKTIDDKGKPARLFTSSFNQVNVLKDKVTPQEYLNYSITDFYELTDTTGDFIKAVGKDIYRFEYTYNDSYEPSPAFVTTAGGSLFLLIGVRNLFEMLCFGDCGTIDDRPDDSLFEEDDDNLDFSMF